MPLPGIYNQAIYPDAEDLDDCWVVATVWAARASDPNLRKPTVTEFRRHAGDPDDGVTDGGTLEEVVKGARGSWPTVPIIRYHGSWQGFLDLLHRGKIASAAVLSMRLPMTYGFLGWHQVGVAFEDGRYYVANPLAPEGSAPTRISVDALRAAVMPLGYARAVFFPAPETDVPGLAVTAKDDPIRSGVFTATSDGESIYLHDRSKRDPVTKGAKRQALGVFLRDFDGAEGYVITEGRFPAWIAKGYGTFVPDTAIAPRSYTVRTEVGGKVITGNVTLP